jgi:DNA repair exonuclease SbcCD ATPase subunit
MADELKEVQSLIEEFNIIQEDLADMKLLMEDYYNRKKELEQAVPYLDDDLELLSDRIETYGEQETIIFTAEDLLAEFEDIQNKIREWTHIDEQDITELTRYITSYKEVDDLLSKLFQQAAVCGMIENDITAIEEKLEIVAKDLPDVCPICGHEINKGEL